MKRRVLVDAGPLVAIILSVDSHHDACIKALHELPGPLYSCWPVITEAAWLLRSRPEAVRQLLRSCGPGNPGGFLELLPLAGAEAGAIAGLMQQYQDLRPQLADAALVYLAEREEIDTVFTLDRRDFSVYRSGRRRPFHIVP